MRNPHGRLALMKPLMNALNASAPAPHWLAIRLPHLALDLHTRGHSGRETAIAVSALAGGREQIIDCNPAALSGGVRPGMPASAARAILNELHTVERDPEAVRHALERLAACCYQYSNQVCIPGERDGLLLEAGASERLFGAPQTLGARLHRELGQLGYHAMSGSATTPEAAWLAAGESRHISAREHLRDELGPLPLARLPLEPSQVGAMEKMGFRQLRDLLRLPRRSLTRRFGPSLTDYLDRLLGIRADPRKLYRPPESFSSRLAATARYSPCS